jgi:hypothetical protein
MTIIITCFHLLILSLRISSRTSGPLALGQEFNGTSHTQVLKDSVGALGGLAAFI